MELVDITGYSAMLILMISFTLKDIVKLRIVNSIACVLFVIYGIMLGTKGVPIAISNTFIILVNLYYLIYKNKKV